MNIHLTIKQALVGYGRADKKQVQAMVKAILNLDAVPKPDDTADAGGCVICHDCCLFGRNPANNKQEIYEHKMIRF